MNKEVKEKWLKALRSGEYKQGKKRLFNSEENTFCCLGVLCDIHSKTDIENNYFTEDGVYRTPNDCSRALLTKSVMEWADIKHDTGYFVTKKGLNLSLAMLNDNQGKSFKQIANYIEKYF